MLTGCPKCFILIERRLFHSGIKEAGLRHFLLVITLLALCLSAFDVQAQMKVRSAKTAVTSAKIYMKHEKWQDALNVIEQGLELDPECVDLYMIQGDAYAELAKYAEADTAFKKAFELNISKAEEIEQSKQRFFRPLMRDGLKALKNERPDSAATFFNNVVALCPEKPEGYINLGIICFNRDDFDCAISNFRQAKMIDPQNESTLMNLARSYSLAGQADSALVVYQEILVLKPDDFHTKNAIATIHLNDRKYDEACAIYDSLITEGVDDANVLYNSGVAYFQTKQYEKAIGSYEKMLELVPDDQDALWNISMAYFQVNEYEKSIPNLEALTLVEPDNPEYWNFLAIAYVQTNQQDKAGAAESKYKELSGD